MSINRVIILGRVGKIETRQSNSGDPIVSMSVATSEKWKDKQGQKQERTEWHNISVFGPSAKFASQYIGAGDLVYIEGKLTTEKYKGKDGVDKYTTKIIASEVQNLVSKNKDNQPKQKEGGFDEALKAVDKHNADKANGYADDTLDDICPF